MRTDLTTKKTAGLNMANIMQRQKLFNNHIVRFLLSAGAGFLVDVSAYYIFYHNLLIRPTYQVFSITMRNSTVSLAISFSMGVIVNFLMTRYIVFTESTLSLYKQFIRFASVAVVGFFANLAIIKLLIQQFNVYPPLARVVAILSLFFASYFIHKVFSFKLALRSHGTHKNNKSGN